MSCCPQEDPHFYRMTFWRLAADLRKAVRMPLKLHRGIEDDTKDKNLREEYRTIDGKMRDSNCLMRLSDRAPSPSIKLISVSLSPPG